MYYTITVEAITSVLLDNMSNIRHACHSIDGKDLLNSGIYTACLSYVTIKPIKQLKIILNVIK